MFAVARKSLCFQNIEHYVGCMLGAVHFTHTAVPYHSSLICPSLELNYTSFQVTKQFVLEIGISKICLFIRLNSVISNMFNPSAPEESTVF